MLMTINDVLKSKTLAVSTVVLVLIVIWYCSAVMLNAPFQRALDERAKLNPTTGRFIAATLDQKRPVLPAPHQVAVEIWNTTVEKRITSKRSLVYHAGITLSSTMLGFVMGTVLGITLAAAIIHVESLERSLMPWIITSQTIPILAIAPMVIVVLNAVGISGLLPKALISTYLSFFPVTVGMVKGLRSPDPMQLDLMRTYSATSFQTFWKIAMAIFYPVPLHLDEDCDSGQSCRCHCW